MPDPTARDPRYITISVMSRLVYRKGMDLVAGVLPEICGRHKDVRFIIGGDGPKRELLNEVCDMHQLHGQVGTIYSKLPLYSGNRLLEHRRE